MKDFETKIESLKTKILEHENDLLKLRARKAALERERDMEFMKEAQKNDKGKNRRTR